MVPLGIQNEWEEQSRQLIASGSILTGIFPLVKEPLSLLKI
jgi:hypothetical protein